MQGFVIQCPRFNYKLTLLFIILINSYLHFPPESFLVERQGIYVNLSVD